MLDYIPRSAKRAVLGVALALTVLGGAVFGVGGFAPSPGADAAVFKPPVKQPENKELECEFIWGVGYVCYEVITVEG